MTNYFKLTPKQDREKTAGDSAGDGDVVDSSQDNPAVASGDTIPTCSHNQEEVDFCGFKNDIGLWSDVITEGMIKYWAKKGSTKLQNCDEVYYVFE